MVAFKNLAISRRSLMRPPGKPFFSYGYRALINEVEYFVNAYSSVEKLSAKLLSLNSNSIKDFICVGISL